MADVANAANAVYDGTTAVMLSGESAEAKQRFRLVPENSIAVTGGQNNGTLSGTDALRVIRI